MLNAARCEPSRAAWEESNVLDFIRQTVENLSVHDHCLGCPFHDHNNLQVVSSEANDNEMFVVMCYSNVQNCATIWDN